MHASYPDTQPAPIREPLTLPEWGRVGVDLVVVAHVARSIAKFGHRYLDRLFTEQERSCCVGAAEVIAAGLAARLAAKEATIKVLRPVGAQPDWRSMEVVRQPGGFCTIALHGTAAEMASAAGVRSLSVSLCHEAGLALAAVYAVMPEDETIQDRVAPSLLDSSDPYITTGQHQRAPMLAWAAIDNQSPHGRRTA